MHNKSNLRWSAISMKKKIYLRMRWFVRVKWAKWTEISGYIILVGLKFKFGKLQKVFAKSWWKYPWTTSTNENWIFECRKQHHLTFVSFNFVRFGFGFIANPKYILDYMWKTKISWVEKYEFSLEIFELHVILFHVLQFSHEDIYRCIYAEHKWRFISLSLCLSSILKMNSSSNRNSSIIAKQPPTAITIGFFFCTENLILIVWWQQNMKKKNWNWMLSS